MSRTPNLEIASPLADKPLSRRVLVEISRDTQTKTPRAVWQHELPILDVVFGEGNCRPGDVAAMNEGFSPRASAAMRPFNKVQQDFQPPSETAGLGFVFIGDARAEFARLVAVYGRHPEENTSFAEYVYGRFQEGKFERLVGKPELEDLPEQQLRAMIRDYGHLPNVGFDAEQSEKDATAKAVEAMNKARLPELVKIAREVGVEIS